MGIPLQLPNLPLYGTVSSPITNNSNDTATPSQTKEDVRPDSHQAMSSAIKSVAVIDTSSATPPTTCAPFFPSLTHLSFARPETLLSKGSSVTLAAEEDLTHAWAQSLFIHFPLLEQLEAWGDSTGRDSRSIVYVLPMEDVLETTWEFLSGIEQSLWQDEDETEEDRDEMIPESFTEDAYVLSPGPFQRLVVSDWELASEVNEFRAH